LLEAEEGAVAHMNADHLDALNLYATKLLGAAPGEWICTGCDPDGLDLQADTRVQRLDFPRRIVTPGALRQVLRELAEKARAVNN
jgi:putative heme iron utilization protein